MKGGLDHERILLPRRLAALEVVNPFNSQKGGSYAG